MVREQIDSMFSIPTITCIDNELIDILARIRDCAFYGLVSLYQIPSNPYQDHAISNFKQDLFEYYQLYKKLSKYCKPFEFAIT